MPGNVSGHHEILLNRQCDQMSKMDRFNPQTEKVNLIPSTPPLPEQLSFSRKPASIDKKPKNKKKLKPSKHLYFLTLFEQYQKLTPLEDLQNHQMLDY